MHLAVSLKEGYVELFRNKKKIYETKALGENSDLIYYNKEEL